MKKVISLFLSIALILTSIISMDLSALAIDNTENDNFNTQEFFNNYQNKADDFNYLQYVSHHYTSEKVKNTIEFRINQDTNCYNLVNYLKNDLWFKGNYAAWEAAAFVTNPSEIIGKQLNKVTYYETVILRILNSSVTSDNAIDWLNQGAIKNSVKISKHITQAAENDYYAYLADMHMAISNFTKEEYDKTIDFTKNYINSQGYKVFGEDISFLSDVLSMSQDIEEYSEKLASYCQLIELGEAVADFLEEVKNNSDDKDLIKAIDKVIPIIKDSYSDMLKTAAKDGLYCIGSIALKKIVGDTWKKCLVNLLNNGYLFDGTAIVGSVFLAIGVTKTFTNIAFSVDAKLDKYELMKALCSFEQSMEAALHKKLNTCENTDEYANVLLEGVSIVYQTYIVDTEVYSEMTRICQNDWLGNLSRDEYEKIIEICNYNKELYQNEYDSLKIVSGVCGDTLGWVITFDNELLIYGIGEMYDFEKEKAPWYISKDSIAELYVSSFLSKVGSHAFENLTQVTNTVVFKTIISNTESFNGVNTKLIFNGDLSLIGNHNLSNQWFVLGDLYCNTAEKSDIQILSGAVVNVEGNANFITKPVYIEVIDSSVNINAGAELNINGDLTVSGSSHPSSNWSFHWMNFYINGRINVKGNFKDGIMLRFYEQGMNGYFKVEGDYTQNNFQGEVSNGTIEIKGNYTGNINATNENTIILSGNEKQTINGINANNLTIENSSNGGVDFSKESYVIGNLNSNSSKIVNGKNLYINGGIINCNIINGDINLQGTVNITQNINILGDLYCNTTEKSDIQILSGAVVNVEGNANFITKPVYIEVIDSSVNINAGAELNINGDLTVSGSSHPSSNWSFHWMNFYINGRINVKGNFKDGIMLRFYEQGMNGYFKVEGKYTQNNFQGEVSNGTIEIKGNYTGNLKTLGDNLLVLSGKNIQMIAGNLNFSNIEINNKNNIHFNSDVTVATLFNHNGNQFTLYNDGKGSTFPDYDGDSYKDNVDPYPLVKHPDEHDYVFAKTVAPTCLEQGYDAYICPYCNGVDKRNLVDIIPHNYAFSETVLPTCTAQGYDLYICSLCNANEKRNYTNKIPHEYAFTKTVLPTCTAQGYDLYTCSNCNGTEKRNTVSAIGHKYSFTQNVVPTCTTDGYDLYTCSNCNGTEKRNIVSSTGHSYAVTSNTATCTEAGIKISVCSKCGDKKEENVSALGHTYSKVYTAPTCTQTGGYTNTCTRCGDITYDVYNAKGHDYGELLGIDYINKISGSTISSNPSYFNEYYHTSTSFRTNLFSSANMAVPNEIRLDIRDMETVKAYRFAIKGSLFKTSCDCIFAYNANTGRTPEQSAIPYTDKDGNLVNMHYIDYKTNNVWVNGQYLIENNKIVDLSGNIVCDNFSETRPHIVYTKDEAIEKGILNNDGTVNVSTELITTEDISFSAGIPGVYFTATHITSTFSRQFIDVFGFDKNMQGQVKAGIYDVNLCFYNPTVSGLSKTTFKIYDGSLINKIPATLTEDERIEYTCMDCGETHVETCALNLADFKIAAASISLANNIRMNYKVLKTAVADFENPYIEVTRNGKTVKITEYSEQGDYYVFSYRNIAPQCMGDTLTAVLYGTHNGILYSSNALDFSVKEYAYRMLQICEPEQYSSLRTLLVDMLNYGSEAQIYMNYSTDKLVNADLTELQKTWASSDDLVLNNITNPNYKTVDSAKVIWKGAGLSLYDSISVRYTFATESIDDLIIKVQCVGSEWIFDKTDIIDNGNGTYSVLFNQINAHQLFDEIYITAYVSDVAVSNTLLFSVESYAAQIQSTMQGTTLESLTSAMIKYGVSAKKYAK